MIQRALPATAHASTRLSTIDGLATKTILLASPTRRADSPYKRGISHKSRISDVAVIPPTSLAEAFRRTPVYGSLFLILALTVNNMLCEGIDSALLPDTAPQF
jgi:hypothetical protein